MYGHAVVSDQAVAIGVTAVPTPNVDNGSDLWFVFEAVMSDIKVGSDQTGFGRVGIERIIDSRAMRKVEDGQDLVVVAEAGTGSDGMNMGHYVRTLIKLH